MGDPEESRYKQQRDELQLLNEVMRHDIRNNLQLVQAYAEMLDSYVEEDGMEYLQIVKENAQNAVDLTTAARDLSQVLLQETDAPTPIPLDPVLEQQIDQVRSAYPGAVIRVRDQIPDVTVTAGEMLSSVFRNLLTNAIKHNDKSPPEVSIAVSHGEDAVVVSVADNGPGVPDPQKETIFAKGEKGLDSPGAGIGLYLVGSLVDSYGGDVWVEDNEPAGAVFSVELSKTA